ncbi:MAG: hypothetical protein ACTTKO_02735 [Candidatus Limimorpha sp.]
MLTNVYKKEVEDLYKTPVVQQTSFWSLVKKKQGASPIAIDFKSRESDLFANVEYDRYIYSDFLVIVRHLSSDMSVAYVPYGPELEPDEQYQGVFLEEISECIRPFLPKTCILIRYDLSWESCWANDPRLLRRERYFSRTTRYKPAKPEVQLQHHQLEFPEGAV